MNGKVQVYTGDGKGKTTAALGLILRATGAGLRVYLGQFLKSSGTNEIRSLKKRFPEVTVEVFGSNKFVRGIPSKKDIALCLSGMKRVCDAVSSGKYDMVICDEINVAAGLGIIKVADVLQLIESRPPGVELILTGRGAHRRVVACADLVVEMRNIKHYYDKGVKARRGIEK